jgi:hypothetical protein
MNLAEKVKDCSTLVGRQKRRRLRIHNLLQGYFRFLEATLLI